MENIFRLVSESLARHNFDISKFDDQLTNSDGGPFKPDFGLSGITNSESEINPEGAPLLPDFGRSGSETSEHKSEREPIHQPVPSTSSAWGVSSMEANETQAPNREAKEMSRCPTPLPSGF